MPNQNWIKKTEAAIVERTGGTITIEQAKEALVRTISDGSSDEWIDCFGTRQEKRESALCEWCEFLNHLADVLDGKLDDPAAIHSVDWMFKPGVRRIGKGELDTLWQSVLES